MLRQVRPQRTADLRGVRNALQAMYLSQKREETDRLAVRLPPRIRHEILPQLPTLDEDRLHRAIVAALNEYGTIRAEAKADVLELAELAMSGSEDGGMSLLELRQRLDALTVEQAVVLDKILADMKNLELNVQLETVTAEKQNVLGQIAACQQNEERQTAQTSRRQEMEEWLEQQPMCFTEYDDALTRRFVERITVMDAETIQVRIRDTEVVIE